MLNLQPGDRYANLEIVARLKSGLTGSVYQAMYRDNMPVVAKFLEPHRDDDGLVQAYFWNETSLLNQARIRRHPNLVVYVTSCVTQGEDHHYLVTQLVPDSYELTPLLGVRQPAGFVLHLAEQIAGALDYLHYGHPSAPVIHRDVKPSNILVDPAGGAVLIDLGAARQSGFIPPAEDGFGTFRYMPPEQYDLDEQPQTDQFALAVIVYELLTGTTLLSSNRNRAWQRLVRLHATNYHQVRSALRTTPATAAVLVRAMAYNWLRRYDTCEEFAYELRQAMLRDQLALAHTPPSHRSTIHDWHMLLMLVVVLFALIVALMPYIGFVPV